jgi:outer membrane receptor for ferric coprogen and ferric-rhodotorulic acid
MELQGMSEYFTDAANTAKYKGFATVNARVGYTFKNLEMWTNCLNVTDNIFATVVEKNAFGTSYRPGQLRTINIGIAYTFKNNK